jgi:alkylation response protein AidB-like acyl-CoA dehydrogenase
LPSQLRFANEFQDLVTRMREHGAISDPLVRQALAQAWETLQVHYYLIDDALRTIMRGDEIGEASSLAKLSWASWHRRFGELAVSLVGPEAMVVGDGYTLDAEQETFLQSRAETIYGGANEIQKNILAERVLGLPRDPR